MSSDARAAGTRTPAAAADPVARMDWILQSLLAQVRTSMPVKVLSVQGGGLSGAGTVSVRPLIPLVTGAGAVVRLPDLHQVPYLRQGGAGGQIISDPVVGDYGQISICDRDIGPALAAAAAGDDYAPPGDGRMHNLGDAIYIGTLISSAPARYVLMSDDGIKVHDPAQIVLDAPAVIIGGVNHVAHTHSTTLGPTGPAQNP